MMNLKKYITNLKRHHKIGLIVFCTIALLHKFIANEKYIVAGTENGIAFFVEGEKANKGIKTLIPYSPNSIDKKNRKVGPLSKQDVPSLYYRHWLGTDSVGRDVLAGIIHGSFIAFKVGVVTVLFSLIIGLLFGYLSGYLGDSGARIKKSTFWLWVLSVLLFWFYGLYSHGIVSYICFAIPFLLLAFFIYKTPQHKKGNMGFPFDVIVFRIIEIINAIPGLFILLLILALFRERSFTNVIVVIVFLRWPAVARHLRAEILKIKEEDYVKAAKSINLSDSKIFLHHVLPQAISPIIIICAFSFSTAVLTESTLSFLGIGVPLDQVTWGSLLKEARYDFDSWWLALFPGLAIYALIFLFNSIGDRINNQLRKV